MFLPDSEREGSYAFSSFLRGRKISILSVYGGKESRKRIQRLLLDWSTSGQ